MFKAKRLSPFKKAEFRKKYEEYENIVHGIIEITNDKVVMNKNVDYLQGFYDALDLSHARLKAIEKMSGISDACTKEFIKSALHLINAHCTMTQLWIDKALIDMEQTQTADFGPDCEGNCYPCNGCVYDNMEQTANIQKAVCGVPSYMRPDIATDISDIFKEWDE